MLVGQISTNDPADFDRFTTWFGRKPDLSPVFFDERTVASLQGFQWIIDNVAKPLITKGAHIRWDVPFPGPGQLEAIANCQFDDLYFRLFRAILIAEGSGETIIDIRPPWEMNIGGKTSNFKDKTGVWNYALGIQAWSRVSLISRAILGKRARVWWNPNVVTNACDPRLCLPPSWHYDVIAQDFYMADDWGNTPGAFSYFRDEVRGLNWGVALAKEKGKLYAIGEWGFTSDRYLADQQAFRAWMADNKVWAACQWDRKEAADISCRISAGDPERVATAADFKAAFA